MLFQELKAVEEVVDDEVVQLVQFYSFELRIYFDEPFQLQPEVELEVER
jgi:hypothetical protein